MNSWFRMKLSMYRFRIRSALKIRLLLNNRVIEDQKRLLCLFAKLDWDEAYDYKRERSRR